MVRIHLDTKKNPRTFFTEGMNLKDNINLISTFAEAIRTVNINTIEKLRSRDDLFLLVLSEEFNINIDELRQSYVEFNERYNNGDLF